MTSARLQGKRVDGLLKKMTLREKLGQMWQVHGAAEEHRTLARQGAIGSILNLTGSHLPDAAKLANEFQRAAVEDSRLGIPLILGRDVIHGFRTVMPIPLGQAASFNPDVARDGAAVAAREARAHGINWTFAPMVDISRDPRWGRVAEGCGEDPLLVARMGAAMVKGFQGERLGGPESVAACAKHFVGYGAAEGGRDYNTTWIPEPLLRDVYLAPFRACVEAGAATFMSAFNALNSIPASGNAWTIRDILKEEWGFDGFVVSDWGSVPEMIKHGYCADSREAAKAGVLAGVDMEMVTRCYVENAERLLKNRQIRMAHIDDAVRRILRIKMRLGLFEHPYIDEGRAAAVTLCQEHLEVARRAAVESCVLLKNDGVLPLTRKVRKLAVIGPLADAAVDQLGCWVGDGQGGDTVTPLAALRQRSGVDVRFAKGLPGPRSSDESLLVEARRMAAGADAVVLFLGEESIFSGEAHCRAFLNLPGAQQKLLEAVAATGKPLAVVVMAGRPLELGPVLDQAGAVLWAWHPGTMGGAAIADLLFGDEAPSGKLPISFPATVGQVPVYYNRMNTGRPPVAERPVGVPTGTALDPKDFTSTYLDADYRPLFPFGFGLGYTSFGYTGLSVKAGRRIEVSCKVKNTGRRAGTEVVQLYVRDVAASMTRPVRELKGFQRVSLKAGETRRVGFVLERKELAFHGANGKVRVEPGRFEVWVGGNSEAALGSEFILS